MTIQNALPPYQLRCLACGHEWTPERTSDNALQRESERHLKACGKALPPEASHGGRLGFVQETESEASPC